MRIHEVRMLDSLKSIIQIKTGIVHNEQTADHVMDIVQLDF